MRRPTLLAVFVWLLSGCDDGTRCGTGAFDASLGLCTCPDAADPASRCELPRDAFDVEAHRGARSTLPPGNTLPAFVEAIRLGADTLEGDLRLTLDRRVVLSHDATLASECVYAGDGPAPPTRVIAELLASDVDRFDCHPSIDGVDAPPRLEAVLDLRTRANVRFDLELKETAAPDVDTAMQAFVAYDAACGGCLAGLLQIESFSAEALVQARASYGAMLACDVSSLVTATVDDPAWVASFADVYSPMYVGVTEELVRAYHAAGVRVLPWTVDQDATMCELVRLGVDGLISDDPALLGQTYARCR